MSAVEKSIEETELRRGLWARDEDAMLTHYIASHGEGHWNLLARCSGLKRTGRSCRMRWLNYLKPDIKRGNLTPQEKSVIAELQSKWGNRWSKIAHQLPGRTDNEIKNYWRTMAQNRARQLRRAAMDWFVDSVRPALDGENQDTKVDDSLAYTSWGIVLPEPKVNSEGNPTSPSGDGTFHDKKYPSDPECFNNLKDMTFAIMSPIGAADFGMYMGCQATMHEWMAEDGTMESHIDELWQFR